LFPTLLDKYIAREIFSSLIAVTLVLLLILIGNLYIRLLGEAAEGKIPHDIIFTLLTMVSFKGVVLLIPVSLFIAVLLSLGRLYRDSEMAALRAVGFGYSDILRPVFILAMITAVFLTVMVFYVLPQIVMISDDIKERARKRTDIVGITPGRFIADADGTRVLYVQDISDDRMELKSIFISMVEKDKDVIITGEKARQYEDPETKRRYLLLENGNRYDASPGQGGVSRLQFERHGILLPEVGGHESRTLDALTIDEIWGSDDLKHLGEIQWRLSFPISALLLAMLAVPLSYTSPRKGRYGKLAIAVVIYGLYSNFLVISKSWVVKGEVSPWVGTWWVHALMLCLIVALIFREYGLRWTIKQRLLRRPA